MFWSDFFNRFRRRPWIIRGVLLIGVIALLSPSIVAAVTYKSTTLQRGTIDSPANGTTVIAVQGFKFQGRANGKKPARLVAVGPHGSVKWVYNGSKRGVVWFYDVDPLPNGNLLVTGTKPGNTVIYEFNPRSRTTVWAQPFNISDTHDADIINGDQLLVGHLRGYNKSTNRNNARVFIYDLSQNRIVWQWRFRKHGYPRTGGGEYISDWTHVNDVDKLCNGSYLVSVRNFDQVIQINRSTKNTTLRLGSENQWQTLYEQHNPQLLRGENGTPTILVADSENDRIVEYIRGEGSWKRTWILEGGLQWPRDADRLPNGNTLVVDTLNHRVMEVTPTGRIVWEFYAPWAPYDVERIQYGDEIGGPTIREQDAEGNYTLHGSAALTPGTGARLTFSEWLTNAFAGTAIKEEVSWFADRWSHVMPWIRPVWMKPWDFVMAILAGSLIVVWFSGEIVVHSGRIKTAVRQTLLSEKP